RTRLARTGVPSAGTSMHGMTRGTSTAASGIGGAGRSVRAPQPSSAASKHARKRRGAAPEESITRQANAGRPRDPSPSARSRDEGASLDLHVDRSAERLREGGFEHRPTHEVDRGRADDGAAHGD